MANLKNPRLVAIVVIVAILVFVFYWFELRPMGIKKYCASTSVVPATQTSGYIVDQALYDSCLKFQGL